MRKQERIIISVVGSVILIAGGLWFLSETNWSVLASLWLILWGNNIFQDMAKK